MSLKRIFLTGIFCTSAIFFLFAQTESDLAEFQSFFNDDQATGVEKSLEHAMMTLNQAREIGDGNEEVRALMTLGLIYLTRVHDYEKAMDLFVRALALEDSLNLDAQQVLTYVGISRIFEVVGDFHKSAEFLQLAMALNHEHRDINVSDRKSVV